MRNYYFSYCSRNGILTKNSAVNGCDIFTTNTPASNATLLCRNIGISLCSPRNTINNDIARPCVTKVGTFLGNNLICHTFCSNHTSHTGQKCGKKDR